MKPDSLAALNGHPSTIIRKIGDVQPEFTLLNISDMTGKNLTANLKILTKKRHIFRAIRSHYPAYIGPSTFKNSKSKKNFQRAKKHFTLIHLVIIKLIKPP